MDMEHQSTYQFTELEEEILVKALTMYEAYMKEMEVGMLVGDEPDRGDIAEEYRATKHMQRAMWSLVHDETFDKARHRHSDVINRPADINDFSKFDFHQYVREER